MKDTRSLLLVLLSFGMLGTWIYHLYDKTKYSKQHTEIYIKDSIAVAEGVQDSLHKLYSTTINKLDAQLDSTKSTAGLLKNELGNKLQKINRLHSEVSTILKKNNVRKEDIELARKKPGLTTTGTGIKNKKQYH